MQDKPQYVAAGWLQDARKRLCEQLVELQAQRDDFVGRSESLLDDAEHEIEHCRRKIAEVDRLVREREWIGCAMLTEA